MGKFSIFVVGLMTLAGCSQAVDHKGKTPLVEVGHEFLYKEDLQALCLSVCEDRIVLGLLKNIFIIG